VRSQGGRLADGYAGGGSGCGWRRVLRPGDLVLVGERHVGQQHALKGGVAMVTVRATSVRSRWDALRRQTAGPIGVHHDRDVAVLAPEGPGAVPRPVATNGERPDPAGARGVHVGPAPGCPAAICRSRSLHVHHGPSGDARRRSQRWSCARDRRNGGSHACGPPVRLRWAWLPVRARSGMRTRQLGRGRGGRVSGGCA
jgi:hypothetical protein